MQNQLVFLRGRKTVLRPVLEADIPLLLKWVNDPDVWQYLARCLPASEQEERDWVASLGKKPNGNICLMIEVDGKAIGTMGIHDINWKDRTATTGALIGVKSFWGKGYGTDAKMALLNYAFNTLNLRKVMSRVIAYNKRSLAYSLHCGYKIEGRLKEQHFARGRYYDEIILGVFKEDWLKYYRKHSKQK